ncbi:Thiamine pyrophosphate enzyme, central domain-containing [Lecanosticta acicola]|uniref:Thiamine pyrophosphate enzyme, central domain-containing n=1 Tax=Lecanosticta acicola TaxID=111012 RepID=A0AAI8YZG6_9PEZI|nr:Thiamine pyrophosphate enzyme, central domain-containing [Lecanosticta acicola]
MASNDPSHHGPLLSDRPKPGPSGQDSKPLFGSDAFATQLSRLNLSYIALVPGSSYRGLHDSLVNHNGNTAPEMLITLHEEHCISIAHGYAKVARRPMAAALHANVGLMHASMAIYNAWCDRVPILILGATGPLDAERRRPWIDWIHTAQDQAALIRNHVKFDDQPHGVEAGMKSLIHAYVASTSKPCAPSYVCFDLALQEDPILEPERLQYPETSRLVAAAIERPGPSIEDVLRIVAALSEAKNPLFLLGRMGTGSQREWDERIALVEKFDGRVLTDIKQPAPFPYPHALQPTASSIFLSPASQALLRQADVILSFDWVDLAGDLHAAGMAAPAAEQTTIIHISLDSILQNGWSKDHFALPPADMRVLADVDKTLASILTASESIPAKTSAWETQPPPSPPPPPSHPHPNPDPEANITLPDLARALYTTLPPSSTSLVRIPLAFPGSLLQITHPLAFLGLDGGAGLGSGPGQIIGTALALHEAGNPQNLTTVGILGDGDYLMASSALWTAARYNLPCLVIVANNGSYYNDEVHQERVAKRRQRPVENRYIGMRLDSPPPDLQRIAEGHGCAVVRKEQVTRLGELEGAMRDAVEQVRRGKCVVLDVRVLPEGYAEGMSEKE